MRFRKTDKAAMPVSTQLLQRQIEDYIASIDLPASPAGIYDPIRYTLSEGGKRIRPLLVMMASSAFGGDEGRALPLAAAVELFHNFTLIHDDIMDNAPVRRGKPSVYARWDGNTAILSGDVMMLHAYKILSDNGLESIPGLMAQFSLMAIEVCRGQQYDMDFESRGEVGLEEYMQMISLKTAALTARACMMGAISAGASADACRGMYGFGRELGLAFQLQDDLLDSYGTHAALGKKIGGDIAEGKKTFLTVTAMSSAAADVKAALAGLLADKNMDEERKIAEVKSIYDSLSVPAITSAAIAAHTAAAVAALEDSGAPAESAAPLRDLALGLLGRDK